MSFAALLFLVPIFLILFINLPVGKMMKKTAFWLALLLPVTQVFLLMYLPVDAWKNLIGTNVPLSNFNLALDNLTVVLLVSIGIVVFTVLITGQCTMNDEKKRFNFINLVLIVLTGMNGTVLVTDLFTLYVFIEITSIPSFILIAYHKNKLALEGAFKYIVLSALATVMMLTSIAILFMASGGTSFSSVAPAMKTYSNSMLVTIALNLFVAGLFIKGGVVPFHSWLPDAHSTAPGAVSILLSGVIIKASGIYVLIRLLTTVFGFSQSIKGILLFVGILSIFVGALAALNQTDFKRILAYSTVSQVGYIILGLGTGTPLGIAGAVFHLFNHSIFKSLLFLNATTVEKQTGTKDITKLGGLGSRMPVTVWTSVVAFLSTAGIPPLAGFWSKLIIIIALWNCKNYIYAVLAVTGSLITLAYFLTLQKKVFFGNILQGLENIKEAKTGLIIPAIILALITIGVGIFFPFVLNSFILPVQNIF